METKAKGRSDGGECKVRQRECRRKGEHDDSVWKIDDQDGVDERDSTMETKAKGRSDGGECKVRQRECR